MINGGLHKFISLNVMLQYHEYLVYIRYKQQKKVNKRQRISRKPSKVDFSRETQRRFEERYNESMNKKR